MVFTYVIEKETTPLTKTATIFLRPDKSGQRHATLNKTVSHEALWGLAGPLTLFSQLLVRDLQEGAPGGSAALKLHWPEDHFHGECQEPQETSEKKGSQGLMKFKKCHLCAPPTPSSPTAHFINSQKALQGSRLKNQVTVAGPSFPTFVGYRHPHLTITALHVRANTGQR